VALCNKAETGVGASIAAVNQVFSPICPLLVMAPIIIKRKIRNNKSAFIKEENPKIVLKLKSV
jgi:hypothetical protein